MPFSSELIELYWSDVVAVLWAFVMFKKCIFKILSGSEKLNAPIKLGVLMYEYLQKWVIMEESSRCIICVVFNFLLFPGRRLQLSIKLSINAYLH